MESFALLRKLLGIDITLVAERSGYSRQAISAAESGAVLPRRPMLREWNRALIAIALERLGEGVSEVLRERVGFLELALRDQVERADQLQAELDALRSTALGAPAPPQPPPPQQEAQGQGDTAAAG